MAEVDPHSRHDVLIFPMKQLGHSLPPVPGHPRRKGLAVCDRKPTSRSMRTLQDCADHLQSREIPEGDINRRHAGVSIMSAAGVRCHCTATCACRLESLAETDRGIDLSLAYEFSG